MRHPVGVVSPNLTGIGDLPSHLETLLELIQGAGARQLYPVFVSRVRHPCLSCLIHYSSVTTCY